MTPVSILIPCYNKRAYVAAAIDSALAQTHPCEVIVVDDGSTDGSLDEVRRFDGRIRWETGANRGGSAARNRALELAGGTYIQFLDADDILPPDKIARQLATLSDAPADAMAFCPWSFLHDSGQIDPPDARRYWHDYARGSDLLVDMWYRGGFFPPHCWLTPRALIDRAGNWDETLTGDDDGEFFGRMLMEASELRFCQGTRVLYRDPPAGSVSRDKSLKSARSFWQAFENVSRRLLAERADKAARRACLSRARRTAYAWRDAPEVVEKVVSWERRFAMFDLSPALPPVFRYLVAIFGVSTALRIRKYLSWRAAPDRN